MTKEEAIEHLEHCGSEPYCYDYQKHNCSGCNARKALNMGITALRESLLFDNSVEAIPVEWIQRKIDMLEQNMCGDLPASTMLAQLHELVSLKRLVTDWEKEHWTKIVGENEE